MSTLRKNRLVTVKTGRFVYGDAVRVRLRPGDYVVDVVTVATSRTTKGQTTDVTTVVRQVATHGEVVRADRATRLHVVTV